MSNAYMAEPKDTPGSIGVWILTGFGILAAFLALNALAPQFQSSAIEQTVIRTLTQVLFLFGAWQALARTGLSRQKQLTTWLTIAAASTAWLLLVWSAAYAGLFAPNATRLPLLPADLLFVVVLFGSVSAFSSRIGEMLDAVPSWWLVAIQTYRIFGAIFLFEWLDGHVPAVFALPAGVGDVLTGLAALPVAALLARRDAHARRVAITWNIFGLLDMSVAIFLGATTSPGPLQLFSFAHPNLGIGQYPMVMIPAVTVPMSIMFHVLSLRQLRRMQFRARETAV